MTRKPVRNANHYANGTWIEPEDLAYNTYSGTHWRSGRRACAYDVTTRKNRIVTVGVADNYFTVPAHDSRNKVGFVTPHESDDTPVYTLYFIRRPD
jgi:hypothetical protein